MKPLWWTAVVAGLAGCAGLPDVPDAKELFEDARFQAPAVPVPDGSIFSVSAAMREYLDGAFVVEARRHGIREALGLALRADLRLDYDAAYTRNAAEAFEERSGNCLSLVILAGALARHLNLPVTFQAVYGEGTWTRDGTLAFHSNHVNLLLGESTTGNWAQSPMRSDHVIDFLPPRAAARQRATPIPEHRVAAMYRNNRAAELLVAGDVNSAYWWARAAIVADPDFTPAYNTLGVIYGRHGETSAAERSFRLGLDREPENPTLLGNLIRQLERGGRLAEAPRLEYRLAQVEPFPPFYFLDLGLAALERGDSDEAIRLFNRELKRMPFDHEVQFGLARAHHGAGRAERAREHLQRAVEYSGTRERRELYAGKLNYLKSLESRLPDSGTL